MYVLLCAVFYIYIFINRIKIASGASAKPVYRHDIFVKRAG